MPRFDRRHVLEWLGTTGGPAFWSPPSAMALGLPTEKIKPFATK